MERQKSSTERASPTGSAQCLIFSCRRSYIPAAVPVPIMSSDVFVQQLFPVFPADTTVKTASAVHASIPLSAASQAIPDHIRRPAEKTFLTISVIIFTNIDFNLLQRFHPAKCPSPPAEFQESQICRNKFATSPNGGCSSAIHRRSQSLISGQPSGVQEISLISSFER